MAAKLKDLGKPDGIDRKEMAELWRVLFNKCLRRVRNRTRAEVVAQNVWVKVIRIAKERPDDGRPLLPYLLRAVDTLAVDEARSEHRLKRLYTAINAPALAELQDEDAVRPDYFIETERERKILECLTHDELRLLRLLARQQGHVAPSITARQAAAQLGLRTENQFRYRVEKLKEKINRVVEENGIDFEIPPAEPTPPSASQES